MQTKATAGDRLPDLGRACRALAAGWPAVVPNPAPMTYSIVATSARSINAVKGRPLDQSVAVSMHAHAQWELVAPSLDLGPHVLDSVTALLARRITILAPLRASSAPPEWIQPAIQSGRLAAFDGYWAPTSEIWDQFPQLYGSSANLTGQPPSATAAQATAVLGAECAIVNGESFDDHRPRWPSTMVRIDRDGRLALHRTGAHDAASGLGPAEFIRQLGASLRAPHVAVDELPGRAQGAQDGPEPEETGR